ncbi:MAG TPA: hypothetical protein VHZ27_15340 [Solirubrobacteraceae bacterium]|nr:hypothetical protein [Solirubrobacteraceae bacterium]
MAGQNKNWREVRGDLPLNETQMAIYKRLMDAEVRLDDVRRRRGVTDTALGDAIDASEEGGADDVYLSTLARYIAALGGHLEVQAVFPEERITLFRQPDSA